MFIGAFHLECLYQNPCEITHISFIFCADAVFRYVEVLVFNIFGWLLSTLRLQISYHLIHWGRDIIAAIWQMTFSNAFSSMKVFKFRWRLHWSLFLRFQSTIFQHWFRYWFGADQATNHYLNHWWLVYWPIYASLGLSEIVFILNLI